MFVKRVGYVCDRVGWQDDTGPRWSVIAHANIRVDIAGSRRRQSSKSGGSFIWDICNRNRTDVSYLR